MHVQVIHCLAALRIAIHDEAIAGFRDAAFPRQCLRPERQASHDVRLAVIELVGAHDVFFRNDEDVYGRLGGDVVERDDVIVLEHDVRWDFVRRNLAEYAVWHGWQASKIQGDYT